MAKRSRVQIQGDEMKLLSELKKNANENLDTIAKHCGFSTQKTSKMKKQLESNGMIWGYSAIFDEEKTGTTHFMLMIKRTNEKLDEKTIDKICSIKLEELTEELGITIETSAYVHGEYDWVLTFTAENIITAKKFVEKLINLYPSGTKRITILQTLMFIRKHYILNPDRQNLKEFM